MLKSELLEENAGLKAELQEAKDSEAGIRKEFAKAFGWDDDGGIDSFTRSRREITPSWAQIFIQLGKVLEANKIKTFYDLCSRTNEDMMNMKVRFGNLEDEVRGKDRPEKECPYDNTSRY